MSLHGESMVVAALKANVGPVKGPRRTAASETETTPTESPMPAKQPLALCAIFKGPGAARLAENTSSLPEPKFAGRPQAVNFWRIDSTVSGGSLSKSKADISVVPGLPAFPVSALLTASGAQPPWIAAKAAVAANMVTR